MLQVFITLPCSEGCELFAGYDDVKQSLRQLERSLAASVRYFLKLVV
jgi:hypothetical protein